jgi:hypothetical protein
MLTELITQSTAYTENSPVKQFIPSRTVVTEHMNSSAVTEKSNRYREDGSHRASP